MRRRSLYKCWLLCTEARPNAHLSTGTSRRFVLRFVHTGVVYHRGFVAVQKPNRRISSNNGANLSIIMRGRRRCSHFDRFLCRFSSFLYFVFRLEEAIHHRSTVTNRTSSFQPSCVLFPNLLFSSFLPEYFWSNFPIIHKNYVIFSKNWKKLRKMKKKWRKKINIGFCIVFFTELLVYFIQHQNFHWILALNFTLDFGLDNYWILITH